MTTYDWAMCDKDTGNIDYILSVNSNDAYSVIDKIPSNSNN